MWPSKSNEHTAEAESDSCSTPTEIAHQINDSGASFILIDPSLLPTLDEARPFLRRAFAPERVILLSKTPAAGSTTGSSYKTIHELLNNAPGVSERFDGDAADTTALVCYSSGTTGLPKGVETTHYNITSEIQSLSTGARHLLSGFDVTLGVLPFSHIYGLVMQFLQPITVGVPVVVLPRFQEIPVLEAIQKYKITHAFFVPPIFIILLNSNNVAKYDLSSLATVFSGAAPIGGEVSEAFAKKLDVVVLQAYGNTETTSTVTAGLTHEFLKRPGAISTVGKLMPTYQARLVDEDGEDHPERGELWVRGPSVMKGHLNNPEATKKALAPGGWYRTGDVCVRSEDGWYTVVDRIKELIKYKGFQVPPAELEALLLQHPDVLDAGVIGVYDKSQATELPRAYIVARGFEAGGNGEAEQKLGREIAAWVAGRVARHKRLVGGVILIPEIPKSPSGKILRKELRVRAEKEIEAYGLPPAPARL